MEKVKILGRKVVLLMGFLTSKFMLFASGDLGGLAQKTQSIYSDIRQVAIIVAAMAAIGGGIATAFKMKNAEGGEGKKALFNYIGGVIFLIIMLFVVDKVIMQLK